MASWYENYGRDYPNELHNDHAYVCTIKKEPESQHLRGSSKGFDLLDLLATVATQALENDPSLKALEDDIKERKPQFIRQPRRLSDYNVFGFAQISKMSLNSLVRLFAETDFDELKRIYRYKCALMPFHICRHTVQSFGNESKAKQLMKAHLQKHIKDLLRTNDYIHFQAKPVSAQQDQPNDFEVKMETLEQDEDNFGTNHENSPDFKKHYEDPMKFFDPPDDVTVETATETVSLNPNLEHEIETIPCDIKEESIISVPDHSYCKVENKMAVESLLDVEPDDEEESVEEDMDVALRTLSKLGIKEMSHPEVAVFNFAKPDLLMEVEGYQVVSVRAGAPIVGAEVVVISEGSRKHQKLNPISLDDKPDAEYRESVSAEKEEALLHIQELQGRGTTTEDLKCKICQKNFTAYTTLLTHLRSHAQIRPFECQVCGAVFTRQHSLNYHKLIHDNSTRFTCGDCGRKFRHPSHFKEHQRRHTNESPFACKDCDQKYTTRNTFKRHLKIHHGKTFSSTQASSSRTKSPLVNCPKLTRNSSMIVSEDNTAKQDFIIDYHYGDSLSNDDEVAQISRFRTEVDARHSSPREPQTVPIGDDDKPSVEDVELPHFESKPPAGVSGVPMTIKRTPVFTNPKISSKMSVTKVLSATALPPSSSQSKLEQCLRYGSSSVAGTPFQRYISEQDTTQAVGPLESSIAQEQQLFVPELGAEEIVACSVDNQVSNEFRERQTSNVINAEMFVRIEAPTVMSYNYSDVVQKVNGFIIA